MGINKATSYRKIVDVCASPKIFHYTCIWLIILVVIGTIAQKQMGLHLAQEKYFSSWFIYPYGIPVPGGRLAMAIMFVNMVFKTFFRSAWSLKQSGVFICHLGVLLLLGGGFITAYFSSEGSMRIREGETLDYYTDAYAREFAFVDEATQKTVLRFADTVLKPGKPIHAQTMPFTFTVKHYFKNTEIVPLTQKRGAPYREIATRVDIAPKRIAANGHNLAGMIVEVTGLADEENGTYIFFESMLAKQHIVVDGKKYALLLRRRQYPLGFSIKLNDFKKVDYPGMTMAKSYSSDITVYDGATPLPQLIRMNEPLRYKGYTFYQSSYTKEKGKETTVLAVVKNYGRTFPYISSIIICIGLMIHLFIMLPQLVKKVHAPAILLMLVSINAMTDVYGAVAKGYTPDLSHIVIQHQGRLKPLDTYARNLLKLLSEKSTYKHQEAIEWFSDVLCNPEKCYDQKIFTIRSPEVLKALKISVHPKSRYSFRELNNAIEMAMPLLRTIHDKDHSTRTRVERQLLAVYNKVQQFTNASQAVSLLIPDIQIDDMQLAADLDMPAGKKMPYISYILKREKVGRLIARLQKEHKTIEDVPPLAKLIRTLNQHAAAPQPRDFAIIPPETSSEEMWVSPWSLVFSHSDNPKQMALLMQFADIVGRIKEKQPVQDAIDAFVKAVGHQEKIATEITYNKADFFYWSLVLYIFAFVMVALSWAFLQKPLSRIAFVSTGIGLILHAFGIGYRYAIMGRPPVSNLYESIVFVAFTSVALCLFIEYRRRTSIALMAAAVSGASLQFIARKYALDGDTMGMLVAVLDSNFWLATHVVTITIGYGATLVAALMGHAYVIKTAIAPQQKKLLREIYGTCVGAALVALFFTTLGTILGGIWADQSWGRFWGWDPKENGALLIVLSLVLLIHGRFSGHFKELGFATGLGLCSIAVVLAWFGVNLLSVGLHNYGFDDGVARNLYIFCVAEVIFSMFSYSFAKNRLVVCE